MMINIKKQNKKHREGFSSEGMVRYEVKSYLSIVRLYCNEIDIVGGDVE